MIMFLENSIFRSASESLLSEDGASAAGEFKDGDAPLKTAPTIAKRAGRGAIPQTCDLRP
jgi:hypothetical protein